jgi:hypothetical protein
MLAPRISEMVAEVRQQEAARVEAARMAQENCPRIFVEGESDRLVLQRALALFFPGAVNQVRFETKLRGAGHSYVIDMLSGWRSQHKHHPDRPKAAGIVDGDASEERAAFNRQKDNVLSAKCFLYPTPAHIQRARAAGFKVHATLETLYPRAVWAYAERCGHLERRDPSKVYPSSLIRQIVQGEVEPSAGLDPEWEIFVTHDFSGERKISTARRLSQESDDACRDSLAAFESVLRDALRFIGLQVT